MSEGLNRWCAPVVSNAGLQISKYAGPETADGQTRVRVQLRIGSDDPISFSIDQWLALGAAVNATTWERRVLPICYDSRCQHRAPHGRYPDCPPERTDD